MWEKEKFAHNEQFLLFPQCFLLNWITVSPFVHIFDIITFFATEFKKPKISLTGKGFPKNPTFNDPKEEGFGKTLWEQEKMLVTSIFSFSHSVIYSFNSLPYEKIFDWSELKAFASDKRKVQKK